MFLHFRFISLIKIILYPMITFFTPNKISGEFDDVLDNSRSKSLSDSMEHINLTYSYGKGLQVLDCNGCIPENTSLRLLDVENLSLMTPKNSSTLVRDLSFAIDEKDHLLVSILICRFRFWSLYTELISRLRYLLNVLTGSRT